MYLFISDINRTDNLHRNSISISDELQQRVNSASFTLSGFSPNYFDDVKIYEGFPIISSDSTSVTIKKLYEEVIQNNLFRIGDRMTFAIWEEFEESHDILSIESDSLYTKINISWFTDTPIAWSIAWRLRFAWNIVDISDSNKTVLGNVEFDVTALDYTRIFDKKLVNDSYADRDARYIINDFCNTTINKNIEIEEFNYANTTALRSIWTNNPTLDTSDYREWEGCMNFTGTSTTATLISIDISEILTVEFWASGYIVDEFANNFVDEFGNKFSFVNTWLGWTLAFWYNVTDISSVTIKIWSDVSNYFSDTFTPWIGWIYYDRWIRYMTETWSVDLTSITYIDISVVWGWSKNIKIDGIRILESSFYRHYPHIDSSSLFQDFRVNRTKPTEVMQRIADTLSWYWYVDYNKYIWLFPNTTIQSPISINETSNNFANLSISYDTSRLINRQVVEWWEETSENKYSQVVEWNGVAREWIMKNKFKNLSIFINDGSSTDTTEVGTTTTNIKATAHGLVTGDYIVNRTRSNAVREITRIDADNFTVTAVTGQTSGDTISLFTTKTVWVEGINVDTSYNFMSNFNEKSIRNADAEPTVIAWQFLLFRYNEVIPIFVQIKNNVSIDLMKSVLGFSDGIFDGQKIVDQTISSRSEAIATAEAMVNKYSNVIITATFTTEQEGLEAGMQIRIKDTDSSERNIDQNFIIQSVRCKQLEWWNNRYTVTCSSLLFGMLELLQQILASNRKIKINENEVVNNIESWSEVLMIMDSLTNLIDGETKTETMIMADSFSSDVVLPPFYWGDIGWWPTEITYDEFVWS